MTKPTDHVQVVTVPVTPAPLDISPIIKRRLKAAGAQFLANHNISDFLHAGDVELLVQEVQRKMQHVLESLLIDTFNDHNTKDTAQRWAKMMVLELFAGRYFPQPDVTEFPNVTKLDQLYVVGPITLRSTCAHHLVPVTGKVWVGCMPTENVIGLSKFHRTIYHLAARPQLQEELVQQIADALEALVKPEGLAVLIRAEHLCCSLRGVKDADSLMINNVVRGALRSDPAIKSEFFQLVEMTRKGW